MANTGQRKKKKAGAKKGLPPAVAAALKEREAPAAQGRGADDDGGSSSGSDFESDEGTDGYKKGGYHRVEVGDVFHSRWKVKRKLGWGHFSTVWLCEDKEGRREVALKVQKSAETYTEAAYDEISLLKDIKENTPSGVWNGCVELVDSFEHRGKNGKHVCMAFEVLGDNLLSLIRHHDYNGIPIPIVKRICRDVLIGLSHIHDRCEIIHTDLKPENVLLVPQREFEAIKQQEREEEEKDVEGKGENRKDGERSSWREEGPAQHPHLLPSINKSVSATAVHSSVPSLPLAHLPAVNSMGGAVSERLGGVKDVQTESNSAGDGGAMTERVLSKNQKKALKKKQKKAAEKLREKGISEDAITAELEKLSLEFHKGSAGDGDGGSGELAANGRALTEIAWTEKGQARQDAGGSKSSTQSAPVMPSAAAKGGKDKKKKRKRPTVHYNEDTRFKLVDFGNACWRSKHFTDDIQTRQYRAPEVILESGYDTPADMWSFACMVFELVTGDVLFDPRSGSNYCRDEDHLARFMETLGPMPKRFALGGKASKDFFTKKGELRHIRDLDEWPLHEVLVDKYDVEKKEAKELSEFLLPFLQFEPAKRMTAKSGLQHAWLSSVVLPATSSSLPPLTSRHTAKEGEEEMQQSKEEEEYEYDEE